eukprot:CAMPEP_0206184374 /NCGR_PEP_ID=MMETSP0166-20121206/1182_1 /ASSEMBLY_ACC=CAM_ASM_000260 /TAXON_ID=95228 /ORGANISM="Vannella robusta, Strain DIVA3 518/3/11/1/6" /LENGTH=516 /DNA_ID=CAMNT_0053599381 /DNA_START=1 /DNA_END=1551 /DNA_ORIENTATION=+
MAAPGSGLSIKTREFLKTKYADCFVGSAMVDWIVKNKGYTRQQAVDIGSRLVHLGLVQHVAKPNKQFLDSRVFYFFTTEVKLKKGVLLSNDLPTTTKEIAKKMAERNSGLVIKPRTWLFTVYPPCFVASEAVDWLLKNLALRTRQEAVDLGNKLVNAGFVQHVREPSPFKDQKAWFRFTKYVRMESVAQDAEQVQPSYTPKDFEEVRLLGEGGYGKVKLVVKKDDPDTFYAMKIIDSDKIQVQSCITEKKVLINDSPFLLHLYYSFHTNSKLYFVTDFLPGGDLFYHLSKRKNRGFHPKVVRFFTAELVLALEHLHQCGVIYRDLKLENVLLDELGHVCLADFGLSKFVDDEDRALTMCGSHGYIAPEIIKGEPYSFQVDWFSLGVMIYELISTNNPFLGHSFHDTSQATLNSSVNYPPSYFSPQLADLLSKLLEKDPEERFKYAAEIKRHPWFKGINWDKLALKRVEPPFDFKPLYPRESLLPRSGAQLSFNDPSARDFDEPEAFQNFDSAFPRV